MKKIIISIVIILAIAIGGFYIYNYFFQTEKKIDTQVYDEERVLKPIEEQLKMLDEEILKEKENLIVGKSVSEIQELIQKKEINYQELVGCYLLRIKNYDQNGSKINSITEINPNAVKEAIELDKKAAPKDQSLYGIPVLLKDNIGTETMATSSGSVALKDWVVGKDAKLVSNLKSQGAIILGKNNMSEWANYLDQAVPNGYSGKKGQVLNPYNKKVDPLGSSTGSAASVTSDFATLSVGTETNGSIIAPSHVQSVVGFKPTRGVVSTEGIIPLSSHLDTPGPITKTVADAALLFRSIKEDSKEIALNENGLKNKRIGVVFGKDDINQDIMKQAKGDLKAAGATLVTDVSIPEETDEEFKLFGQVLSNDFKYDLNAFLAENNAPQKDLSTIIEFNKKDEKRNVKYGQSTIIKADDEKSTKEERDETAKKVITASKEKLEKIFADKNLDAIIMLDSDYLSKPSTAGYPLLTVPAGYGDKNQPVGLTFVAQSNQDIELLSMGLNYEITTKHRIAPELKK
ncbi:amidase [Listeria ivanovii]|uniref:Putative amidase n=1 Tax=Listeria ivanovii (strain ATCC BAA-678 / PAM 55) TaxID=881621 RepID=G2Z9Z8_LISIP|nr:amidase family protein [Listeria ivanovii]MCJ1718415.1 amidase family protein [Listeria ivanovii]MCJ1723603.1 amidase family protein [Listeria ivanovii]MCJ1736053.1 amidase family protein [Listeria ivanovii]PZG37164.1 amidase [Listeria ivanovii]PZG50818.1 amidase [Listeria ivanovii]